MSGQVLDVGSWMLDFRMVSGLQSPASSLPSPASSLRSNEIVVISVLGPEMVRRGIGTLINADWR
jgi:hypothetical protein